MYVTDPLSYSLSIFPSTAHKAIPTRVKGRALRSRLLESKLAIPLVLRHVFFPLSLVPCQLAAETDANGKEWVPNKDCKIL